MDWQVAERAGPVRQRARNGRLLRTLGTLMIVAGLGFIGWALLVWQWQDPVTLVYTKYEQHRLTERYERQAERYAPIAAPSTAPATSRRAQLQTLAAEARRYRLTMRAGEPLGRITVKRMGVSMILVNGTDTGSLKKGPGRDERTAMPGEGRLVYVAGHRTTYAAPFADIDKMRTGDEVRVELPYATFVYRVTGHVIVPADDVGRLQNRGREEIALQACHPRFFASQRYIVYARPLRIEPHSGRPIELPA